MSSLDDKPKRPWSGFGTVIIIVVAILVAYFVVLPMGQQVSGVFEKLSHALGNR